MATFTTINPTLETTSADRYLLRQGAIDVYQTRETLGVAISNTRWLSTGNYTTGSRVVASDHNEYVAVQLTGPLSTVQDPTTDTTNTWWKPPSTFETLSSTTDTSATDEYLLNDGSEDLKQSRETLAAALSNARWVNDVDYNTGSNTVGSDGKNYQAVQPSGPATSPVDPTTDPDAEFWKIPSAGAQGGAGDQVFYLNDNTATASFTIPAGSNAGVFGPLTIEDPAVITVEGDAVLTIVGG